jgi:uncharacterized alpha-E superfamily protein
MLSRVANSLYWLNRYLERADNVAKFMDVNISLVLDMDFADGLAQWQPLVMASGDQEDFEERYSDAYTQEDVVRFLMFDEDNANSVFSCLIRARENARTIREVISTPMWEAINELYHLIRQHSDKQTVINLQELLSKIHSYNYMITGLMANTISHDEGWHFANLGRMMERADKIARIIDVKYFVLLPSLDYIDSPYESIQWGALLKSVNGFEMYLKQFHRINHKKVAKFLILDSFFPYAIKHCVDSALISMFYISEALAIEGLAKLELNQLAQYLKGVNIDDIISKGLHEFIDALQSDLNLIDSNIDKEFFSYNYDNIAVDLLSGYVTNSKQHQLIDD